MDRSRSAVVVLAAIGTAVSAYLTWVHYSGSLALCVGVGGCEAVQTSRFAMIGSVPVALIGLVGMAAILAVALLRLRSDAPWAATALFAMSVAATAYVAYLTYIELFVLGAVCPWCVSVAVVSVLIFAITAWELFSTG